MVLVPTVCALGWLLKVYLLQVCALQVRAMQVCAPRPLCQGGRGKAQSEYILPADELRGRGCGNKAFFVGTRPLLKGSPTPRGRGSVACGWVG